MLSDSEGTKGELSQAGVVDGRGGDKKGPSSIFSPKPLFKPKLYREENNGWYVVARNFFLLFLNCSVWLCLGPA